MRPSKFCNNVGTNNCDRQNFVRMKNPEPAY